MSQTVLVADDSKTIREIVEMALKASSWEVVGVGSAQDAMQAARQNPTVILLDYYMPDGSGYDVCRALKQDSTTRAIPIVMLGGNYKSFDESLARQAGADLVLMKPFRTDALLNAIEEAQNAESALPIPSMPAPIAEPDSEPQLALESSSEEEDDAYGYGYSEPSVGDEASSEPMIAAPEPEQPVYDLPMSEEDDEPEDMAPMPTPMPQAPSQPRIPAEPARGSSPDIPAPRQPVATPMPTPMPTPVAAAPGLSRDEIEAMIREEVKSAVRTELPGLLRTVMGDIFQNKILPKLLEHAEARVQAVVKESLSGQIQNQVRVELERLLSEE